MKKTICIILALIFLLSVVSCDGTKQESESNTVSTQTDEKETVKTENETTTELFEATEIETKTEESEDITTVSETETTASDTETTASESETVTSEIETTETESETETEAVKNISAVEPAEGAEIVLANDTIYNWWKNYNWKKDASEEYYLHLDQYYPNKVYLKWDCKVEAKYFRVRVSRNADLSEAENYVTNTTELELKAPYVSSTYYWQVDAVCEDVTVRSAIFSFKTAESPRCFEIEGVSNTRDIGGYEMNNGYRIRQGMIYRGGKLEDITEAGKEHFRNDIGIKTDLDLRTPGEGGAGSGSPLGKDINYVNINGRYYVGGMGIQSDEGKAVFAEEIRLFANPDNYPIYIHCSLGRDRTGTLAFVLEALLGADVSYLIMDYELSVFSVTGTLDNASVAAIKSNIQATFDYIKTFKGSGIAEKTENYLLSIGITAEEIQAIRDILLEEVK